ncbi:MAG TPA: site-specific DNA-methyltransferase [bacterium]|nr:site-specific DNA-methyltransferase [bacterium]HQL60674.1 site-specific DNA-methyltransferase [bacterium]
MPRKKKQEESAAIAGPEKGDFIAPPPTDDEDLEQDVEATLPQQEEFWRPPVRFGSVPVEKEPLGWDRRKAFRKLFPRVALPFQVVERVAFGHPDLEPNRLFWGDNLHVMRQLPSESIDLIYIDPPFFSGRQYNVIFGDQNELRSFSDIWEGGMPGYLIWFNARLFEMRRLLKKTGSIYVHLDWHAVHYVKVEMDRIFGADCFRNEVIWYYYNKMHDRRKRLLPRAHDSILVYGKTSTAKFNQVDIPLDEPVRRLARKKVDGKAVNAKDEEGNLIYITKDTRALDDIWRISMLQPADKTYRIGYPTEKPPKLLEFAIQISSDEGDMIADFFCGGGVTPFMAQRLGRRWIACDQSRVAVAITADRLTRQVEEQIGRLFPVPDFTIEHWGVYEAKQLSETPPDQFRAFVLKCYGAVEQTSPRSRGERGGAQASHTAIHGYKGAIPIWVGEPSPRKAVSAKDVEEFANALRKTLRYQQDNLREGTMLAWAFRQDALDAADRLRRSERTDLNFVRLDMIRIDSPQFRQHVATLSTTHADYENFLTFVQPPRIEVLYKRIAPLTWSFDVSDTVILNPGAKIINVQWDFDYGKRFSSTPGYSFVRGSKKEPQLQAQYKFASPGKKRVACKVQDDMGGEGLWSAEIKVE